MALDERQHAPDPVAGGRPLHQLCKRVPRHILHLQSIRSRFSCGTSEGLTPHYLTGNVLKSASVSAEEDMALCALDRCPWVGITK